MHEKRKETFLFLGVRGCGGGGGGEHHASRANCTAMLQKKNFEKVAPKNVDTVSVSYFLIFIQNTVRYCAHFCS